MLRKSGSVPQSAPPTFREVAPEWATLSNKMRELCIREAEIIAEFHAQQRGVEDYLGAAWGHRNPPEIRRDAPEAQEVPKKLVEKLDAARNRVKALLGGAPVAVEPFAQPEPAADDESEFSKRMRALAVELEDVREAIALIHPALRKAHIAGSRAYCALRRGEYDAVTDRMGRALIEFGEAVIAHDALVYDMVEQGADWVFLKPVDIESIGCPRTPYSPLRRFLSWCAESGHFDGSLIPSHWYRPKPEHKVHNLQDHMRPTPEPLFKAPAPKQQKNPLFRVANSSAPSPDTIAAVQVQADG
jgi:hypothetical protein